MPANPQLNANGELQHLLSIEGLPRAILEQILNTAESFVGVTEREVKKVPLMRGKSVFNLFFEPSTRTRTTFEIAAKRLSADVINLNVAAISKVVRVRVEGSKNRLNTLLPRSSGTFFTSRSVTPVNGSAVSRICVRISRGSPSIESRCCSSPFELSWGL